jgi:hypothetical protein
MPSTESIRDCGASGSEDLFPVPDPDPDPVPEDRISGRERYTTPVSCQTDSTRDGCLAPTMFAANIVACLASPPIASLDTRGARLASPPIPSPETRHRAPITVTSTEVV